MDLKGLLFQTLLWRALRSQAKTLAAAIVTVSLGVGLALGIRLGTESARSSLEKSLDRVSGGGWLGPIEVDPASAHDGKLAWLAAMPHVVFQRHTVFAKGSVHGGFRRLDVLVPTSWQSDELAVADHVDEPESPTLADAALALRGESSSDHSVVTVQAGAACRDALGHTESFVNLAQSATHEVPVHWRFDAMGGAECSQVLVSPEHLGQFRGFEQGAVMLFVRWRALGLSPQEADDRLASMMLQHEGISYVTNEQRLGDLSSLTESMRINLQLMGLVAVIIGMFMVNHVMTVVMRKQARAFATLSAQGVSVLRQIQPLAVLVLIIGTVSALLGIVLGVFCGRFVAALASRSFRELYDRGIDPQLFTINPLELLWAFLVGLVTAVVGAAWPVLRLRRLDVAEVLRTGDWVEQGGRAIKGASLAFLVPLICLVLAVLLWRFPVFYGRQPISSYALCFVVLCGAAFTVPMVLDLFHSGLRRFLLLRPSTPGMAALLRLGVFLPPQSAVLVQVLVLCFALTLGVRAMSESFRSSLVEWSQRTIRADLWVRHSAGSQVGLPQSVVDQVRTWRTGDLALAVDGLRVIPARMQWPQGQASVPIALSAVSLRDQALAAPLQLLDTKSSQELSEAEQRRMSEAMARDAQSCAGVAADPCPAYLTKPLAVRLEQRQLDPAGSITVSVAGRQVVLRPVAVLRDFGNDSGGFLLDAAVAQRHLVGESGVRPGFMNIYLNDGLQERLSELRDRLANEVGPAVDVLLAADLRSQIMKAFDETFAITDALYGLSGLVAFVTVVCSLGLQIVTRAQEWTVLWATGVSVVTLRRRICIWSGHTSFLAYLASVPLGLALAAILVFSVNYHAFGFLLRFDVPWIFFAGLSLVAWIAGYVGGLAATRGLKQQCDAQRLYPE
jgi:putative ABC transport system permease protein